MAKEDTSLRDQALAAVAAIRGLVDGARESPTLRWQIDSQMGCTTAPLARQQRGKG